MMLITDASEAFLWANAFKYDYSNAETEIEIQGMEELAKRQEARGEDINFKDAWDKLTHGEGLYFFLRELSHYKASLWVLKCP